MESFDQLFERAAQRKGGEEELSVLLGNSADDTQIAKLGDDRVLAAFTKQIFKSGFVWRVVENKWPDFEQLFFNFDIEKILLMPDDMLERKAQDPKIIRNFKKVKTIRDNALMIKEVQNQGHSFAKFIAQWPSDDIIGLWSYLKEHGARLGGNTGPYALRVLGKETFILSKDVESYLRNHNYIEGGLTSKTNLKKIQHLFNALQAESGYSLTQLSRLIAYSTGDNNVQAEFISSSSN